MEGLCSQGQQENAEYCCACMYPLPIFCKKHAEEHQSKDPGPHFTLPLSATLVVTSKQMNCQVQDWLNTLASRQVALREKLEEFAKSQEQIEAAYKEIKQYVRDVKTRLKEELSAAKTAFGAVIENAIKETSTNALDTQTFVPVDPLSELLWFYDAGDISAAQLFTFQARSVTEHLDSAFKISLQFTIPGFEDLKLGQNIQSPCEREKELMKEIALKEKSHSRQMAAFRSNQESVMAKNAEIVQELQNSITELSRKLQLAETDIQALLKVIEEKESRCFAQQKEISSLTAELKVKTKELSRLPDLEKILEVLETRNKEVQTLSKEKEQRISVLEKELNITKKEVKDRDQQIKALEDEIETNPNRMPAIPRRPIPIEHFKKLIAVLPSEVKYFDVDSSRWRLLRALRTEINVNHTSSSTFIAPNQIFVCGGGVKPSTCHLGHCAYMLEGEGSVQELPHMKACRYYCGITWDSDRNALYVFGGSDLSAGTCYSELLRSNEVFKSNEWTLLPEMHVARSCFNPCWDSNLVFLCGGFTNSVETYDPEANTFTLQSFTLPESSQTTAVVQCGQLTVISRGHIFKRHRVGVTVHEHRHYLPWSNCTPLLSGGVIDLVRLYENCYQGVVLATGDEMITVKL